MVCDDFSDIEPAPDPLHASISVPRSERRRLPQLNNVREALGLDNELYLLFYALLEEIMKAKGFIASNRALYETLRRHDNESG